MKRILLFLLVYINTTIIAQQKPSYPEPEKGFKKVELELPRIDQEKNINVEIKFGLNVTVSECFNPSIFIFNMKNLKIDYAENPTGFPYYTLVGNSPIEIGPSFNADPNCDKEKKVKKKLLSSQNISREYNSNYNVLFYIPENWTLEYRISGTNNDFVTIK